MQEEYLICSINECLFLSKKEKKKKEEEYLIPQ